MTYREPQEKRPIGLFVAIALVVVLLAGGGAVLLLHGDVQPERVSAETVQVVEQEAPKAALTTMLRTGMDSSYTMPSRSQRENYVSFSAVGDVIITDYLLDLVHGRSGDAYDFEFLYDHVRDVTSAADISMVNQETVMFGNDRYDYGGYPAFNTPDTAAEALSNAGFTSVVFNSNHTYDYGADGIKRVQTVLEKYPQMMLVGTYHSEEDRQAIRIAEVNGVRVALLAYSYGQNVGGRKLTGPSYLAPLYTEEGMTEDVTRARSMADFVVVYMHWGTEYTHVPTEEQREFAQLAANLGVGLVVGTHAHWIQEAAWLDRAEMPEVSAAPGIASCATSDKIRAANDGKMLVLYGLGDFLSGYHHRPETVLSGLFTCGFEKHDNGVVSVVDPVWHPAVEHWQDNSSGPRLLRDYTPELANVNVLLDAYSNPYQWIIDTTHKVIGDVIPIEGITT